jgi:hypothetical protein
VTFHPIATHAASDHVVIVDEKGAALGRAANTGQRLKEFNAIDRLPRATSVGSRGRISGSTGRIVPATSSA